MIDILEVRDLRKDFYLKERVGWRKRKRVIPALRGVSFTVRRGEILGIVGESGCGKTTLGKLLVRLLEPSSGDILLKGRRVTAMPQSQFRKYRRIIQMVFQNPYASLNPAMNIQKHFEEVIALTGKVRPQQFQSRIYALLKQVHLQPSVLTQYPHQLSGGECRRVGLARILALEPEILILDEPVASLDISIKGSIIDLLLELQKKKNLTYIWISHDIEVIQRVSHRILVMFAGEIVEIFTPNHESQEHFNHPYTRVLMEAAAKVQRHLGLWTPNPERYERLFESQLPADAPNQCIYQPYCDRFIHAGSPSVCCSVKPPLRHVADQHYVACHFPWNEKARVRSYA
ncbi:MAG: ABC transporter ATP-binding protein [Calditrichaeota bacterium]|nr:ABC transporter ATP-binding protein [Calditrichota bacterium]